MPKSTSMMVVPLLFVGVASADDWPMFGRDMTRNAVSRETDPPDRWQVENRRLGHAASRNIKWTGTLGNMCLNSPVVADGLVWIGTNHLDRVSNGERKQRKQGAVLRCFRESDGKLLYEYFSSQLNERYQDASFWQGLASSPTVAGDRLWLVTNRCQVICLDIGPLRKSRKPVDELREVWNVDMQKKLGVYPRVMFMGPSRICSIGSPYKDRIYVTTSNGSDYLKQTVPAPGAPSLVCMDKNSGKVHWTDNSPGEQILQGSFGSPLIVEVNGRAQIIAPQGDGWLRSFDAINGELIWEFDINPKVAMYDHAFGRGSRNWFMATPVFYKGKVYIASGQGAEQGQGPGRLCCIDPTGKGDISSELAVDVEGKQLPRRRVQAVDTKKGEKAVKNSNSGLVWEFTSVGDDLEEEMHRTVCTVAIHKNLVIAPDTTGIVHCLDAKTGKQHWAYDTFADIWASPLIVDDKVYVADSDGDVAIFGLSADPSVAMRQGKPLSEIAMDSSVYSSPVFANRTLYVATRYALFAIERKTPASSDKKQSATRGNWPQWRGPNRDNVSTESDLLPTWPKSGPPLAWQVEGIGESVASLAIAGGRVYTQGYAAGSEYAIALDEANGRLVWRTRIGPAVKEASIMRWLSQRTPTIDEDRLYAFTARGEVICLRTEDGRELWRKDYFIDFQGKRGSFGYCDFPLVDGNKLICTPGGKLAAMVALDKKTGETLWQCSLPDEDRSAHAAVVAAEIGGVRQFVNVLHSSIIGVAEDDGRLLWQHRDFQSGPGNTYPPIIHGNRICCPSSGSKGVFLEVTKTDDGLDVSQAGRLGTHLQPWVGSVVLLDDRLYSCHNGAIVCIDFQTGSVAWRERMQEADNTRAALTSADGHLYIRTQRGRVLLVDVSPTGHKVMGTLDTPPIANQPTWSFPIVAGGKLYLRDQHVLLCYDISQQALERPRGKVEPVVLSSPTPPRDRLGERINTKGKDRAPDAIFVPTPQDVVDKMLVLAEVKKSDVICDLGSGDGRIVITAAKDFGCRAIGYEIDAELVKQSRERARAAGVADLARIEHEDIFTQDLSEATVVTVFLYPRLLERLRPQLDKLKPGSRIVSHHFAIPGVEPDKTIDVTSKEDGEKHRVYFWRTPLGSRNPRQESTK